jgi:cytochrome b subunit of formate dehydrogenase
MMKNATRQGSAKKTVILLLAIVIVLYIVTGFGINEFRTIETLTFGLLTKNLAFKIHNVLLIPFIILLILHLCLPYIFSRLKQQNKSENR